MLFSRGTDCNRSLPWLQIQHLRGGGVSCVRRVRSDISTFLLPPSVVVLARAGLLAHGAESRVLTIFMSRRLLNMPKRPQMHPPMSDLDGSRSQRTLQLVVFVRMSRMTLTCLLCCCELRMPSAQSSMQGLPLLHVLPPVRTLHPYGPFARAPLHSRPLFSQELMV
jgi:hypothetical protein